MRVTVVSGLNGAGHFSRVLAIGESLAKRQHSVSMVIGQNHIGLEPERISVLEARSNSEIFVLSGPPGLDGPQWGLPESQNPESVPDEIRDVICAADLVISDNAVWPLQITSKTILMAQFLWVDYWRENSARVRTRLEKEEALLCARVKLRFANPVFLIESAVVDGSRTQALKLFSYPRDTVVGGKPVRNEIWLAGGTTGLNSVTQNFPVILPGGFSLVSRETHLLSESSYQPAAIVGRPGLGSIRDALGCGIPFLPLWEGEDFELNHNSNVLVERNLVWSDWNRSSVEGLNRPTLEDDLENLRLLVSKFVESEFISLDEAVNQILETAEGALHD